MAYSAQNTPPDLLHAPRASPLQQARGIEATWSFSRLTPLYWTAPIVGALQRSYSSVEAPNLMNVTYQLLCTQLSAPCEEVPEISIALMDSHFRCKAHHWNDIYSEAFHCM